MQRHAPPFTGLALECPPSCYPIPVSSLLRFTLAVLRAALRELPLSKRVRGHLGERAVYLALLLELPDAAMLRNLLLPHGSGTSQVDLVVATRGALYVAEVKTWDAAIEAPGDGSPWTVRYTPRAVHSVPCPIRQADSHCQTVKAVLQHAGVSCPVLRSVVLESHRGFDAPSSVHAYSDASKFAAWVSRHSATARSGDAESALEALKAANIRGWRARREHIARARALRQDHRAPLGSQFRPRRVVVTAFLAGLLCAIVYSAVPQANRPRLVAEAPPAALDVSADSSLPSSTLCDELHYALIGQPDTATWAFRATGRQGTLDTVFKQSAIARAFIALDRLLTGGESSVYRPTARFVEAAAVGDLLAGSGPRASYLACRSGSEAPLDHVLEGGTAPTRFA